MKNLYKITREELLRTEKVLKNAKRFCREYVYCGNPKDAAQRAGYTVFPEMCGIRLLTEKRIKEEIAELEGKLAATRAEALCGYRRIAFGNISDAVNSYLKVTVTGLTPKSLTFSMWRKSKTARRRNGNQVF